MLVTVHWSLVTGHWSLVTGHWSLVIGYCLLFTVHWSLVIGYRSLVTGHCLPFTVHRLLTSVFLPLLPKVHRTPLEDAFCTTSDFPFFSSFFFQKFTIFSAQ